MDTATVGLLGATLGAMGALTAVLITHYLTQKREVSKQVRDQVAERERWLRDQRQTCYHNAVKYLIRVRAVGAQAKKTTPLKLPQDAPQNWYDDIAEANAWLSSLHYFCGDEYHDDIGEASTDFHNLSRWLIGFRPDGMISGTEFLHIVSLNGELDYQEFVDYVSRIESAISNTARREFKLGSKPKLT
jgi:hypothetical protein